MGDAGREAERGVIWVSGSLIGRLEGYLKNRKQPAPNPLSYGKGQGESEELENLCRTV